MQSILFTLDMINLKLRKLNKLDTVEVEIKEVKCHNVKESINRCKLSLLRHNLTKIKFITGQGVTLSLFCRKHFASPHIFHCICIELSSFTFSVL